jgi:hypothetical protein
MTDTPQLDGANGSRPRYPDPNEYLHGLVDIGRYVPADGAESLCEY